MCLAGSAWVKGDDILAAIDLLVGKRCLCIATRPLASRQFQNLHLVQGGDRLAVKAIEAFDGREFRGFDPALSVNHL
jgi:hypothetical protein